MNPGRFQICPGQVIWLSVSSIGQSHRFKSPLVAFTQLGKKCSSCDLFTNLNDWFRIIKCNSYRKFIWIPLHETYSVEQFQITCNKSLTKGCLGELSPTDFFGKPYLVEQWQFKPVVLGSNPGIDTFPNIWRKKNDSSFRL